MTGASFPTEADEAVVRARLGQAALSLNDKAPRKVTADGPTADMTSFKVGGPASVLAEPGSEEDLLEIAQVIRRFELPCLVLGRGTNVLISDRGFPGVVIRLGPGFDWIRAAGAAVEAGAATPLPQVANWAARRSLTGMEFAVAIPATVGGAVRMNAGAHASAVSEVLTSARVCRIERAQVETMTKESLEMTYRTTVLSELDVVCAARFQLAEGDPKSISEKMREHRSHRTATQPADAPNAGSVFRNPIGTSAAALIEAAGLKGHSRGGAEVSPKHSNFILAHRGATAQDVYDLMVEVQARVKAQSGTVLIPEVRIVGHFDNPAGLERST